MRRARFWATTNGGAALEFALLCPPLLLLLIGVAEFGRALWIAEALQNSAAQVARCVGLKTTSCAVSGAVSVPAARAYAQAAAAKWGVTLAGDQVSLTSSTSCPGQSGATGFVVVTLSYAFSTTAQSLLPALAAQNLSATACFPQN